MSVTHIPDWMREQVIERDGSKCLRCHVQCSWAGKNRLHIDHIIPEIKGGRTEVDNLQVLCRSCNLWKGSLVRDYRRIEVLSRAAQRQRRLEIIENTVVKGHRLTVFSDYRGWRHRLRYTAVCQCAGTRYHTARTIEAALLGLWEHLAAYSKVCDEITATGYAVRDLTDRIPIMTDADLKTCLNANPTQAKPAPGTKPAPGELPPKIAALADVLTEDEIARLLELEPA